jgi:hypothetical protein
MNRSIKQNKIEAVIKSPPKKKSPVPDGFTAEFFQTFIKNLYQLSLNVSMKQKRKEHYLTHFMKPTLLSF